MNARRSPHFTGDQDRVSWPLVGYRRGHLLVMFRDGQWRWGDSGRFAPPQSRPGGDRDCVLCGHAPTPAGHDPCLGYIEGALAACCGHGRVPGYVSYADERVDLPRLTLTDAPRSSE